MEASFYSEWDPDSNKIIWFDFHYPQSEEATPIDHYLVCGEHYKTIRNAVEKVVMEGKVDGLDETCAVRLHHFLVGDCAHHIRTPLLHYAHVYTGILLLFSSQGCGCSPQWTTVCLLLALYREVTTLYREANANFHPKPEVDSKIKTQRATLILCLHSQQIHFHFNVCRSLHQLCRLASQLQFTAQPEASS